MTDVCLVCQGHRTINLPLYHPLNIADIDPYSTPVALESSRRYDCPECVKKVGYERLGYTKAHKLFDDLRMTPEHRAQWREATIKTAALTMAEHLLREGFVKVDDIPPGEYHPGAVQVTLCAVHPTAVKPMEERIAERQMEVAVEVADEAQRLINNWGSFYRATSINKDTANREVRSAVANIRKARETK